MPRPADALPSCSSCLFYKDMTSREDAIEWGYCRRYPPTPHATTTDDGVEDYASMSPPVHPVEDWCGEWKAKQ